MRRLVVVGASLAATHAVQEARRLGFEGSIAVIGDEPHPPYDRPPLSKQFLTDTDVPEPEPLLNVDALDVKLMTSTVATGLDGRERRVHTSAGDVPYDVLLIATGSEPRQLGLGDGLEGVTTLRTAGESLAIRSRLEPGARVVVVGAGFIGGEVASSARARGADVTLVEALPLPLDAAVGSLVAERLAMLHRQYGVDLRTRTTVRSIDGGDAVEKVTLSDGSVLDVDLVIVGIGVEPSTAWLRGAGVSINNGVSCTPYLESTVPDVYAAGDVARWINPWNGRSTRLEHWTATGEQAEVAVRNALGTERTECSIVPYFWSDWYGHRLQMLGEPADEVELTVAGGATDPFLAQYRYDGQLVGGFSLDQTGPLMKRRRAIAARASWEDVLNGTERTPSP
ncbi:oxidoreductase [Aeromicrobium ginsengisoli]|uniref:Oxidoreductase n=1 Tax=Aeromicrobium ginsengisoli TaxID=363867 RepID=A0A5M4F9Z6_9ACTN|nr:oxidoreductase [Aeromicrobium ginsengisoli]